MTSAESGAEPGAPEIVNGLPGNHDLLADSDENVLRKTNRLTVDDASRQALSQTEIEELKKSSGGKEIVERILANHAGLDEKTAFSKAKYMLRKNKKYLKRFTLLPMDINTLIEYVLEKDAPRIMEMREETLSLVTAWSNAHFSSTGSAGGRLSDQREAMGRWLAVDETGGLIVAALAERMGILYPPLAGGEELKLGLFLTEGEGMDQSNGSTSLPTENGRIPGDSNQNKNSIHRDFPIPETSNTITLIHPAVQPNLSLLKYFGYDTSNPVQSNQDYEHPLHSHLKPLSWLQLLHPTEDPTYAEPEHVSDDILSSWKSGKRGAYYRKRRRWERCRSIVDETRAGDFDGLVVSSHMDPISILQHTVPLIRGGGHVVIYSPTAEPLVHVMDLYSKERRAAYIHHLSKGESPSLEDFPVDPRLLLVPSLQTSRVREWQVLPGRTHPIMTGRGGAEGHVFSARRVIPLDGGVEARGNFATRKRKITDLDPKSGPSTFTKAEVG